jgi:integrase
MRTLQYATNTPTSQTIIDIQAIALEQERKGLEPTTIRTLTHVIKALAKTTDENGKPTDLNNPKEVELAIARYKTRSKQPASNGFKKKLCDCYNYYCKHFNIPWNKPTYKYEEHGIQPPTNEKCLMLISGARMPMSLKIDVSYQTGLRPIEIQGTKGLKVKDFHPDQKTITSLNTKRCNARPAIPITAELTTRLATYIQQNNLQPEDRIFHSEKQTFSEQFRRYKNALAKRLNDQTIKTIRLYDLRHAYITRQLRRTQNAETVRILVGHKTLNTTQKYLHLLTGNNNGEWIIEGTTDTKRAKELLAADFTYQLTAPDGTMIFKKPK